MESSSVTFNKDGTILRTEGYLLAVIPTDEARTSALSHHVCVATFDAKGSLKLDDKPGVSGGPDGWDPLPITELPKACKDLIVIRRLRRAFTNQGLNYGLEAGVVTGSDGKSWRWGINPSEEQMPNVIHEMNYSPDTNRLRCTRPESPVVANKLEVAAKAAGMRPVWVRDARDR